MSKSVRLIICCFFLLFVGFSRGGGQKEDDLSDEKHSAKCTLTEESRPPKVLVVKCQVALFSYHNFNVHGDLVAIEKKSNLCEDGDGLTLSLTKAERANAIIAVKRGMCSFDTKSRNAVRLGFKALLIVNDVATSIMPMGTQSSDYVSNIPVLMVPQNFFAENLNVPNCDDGDVNIRQSEEIDRDICRQKDYIVKRTMRLFFGTVFFFFFLVFLSNIYIYFIFSQF